MVENFTGILGAKKVAINICKINVNVNVSTTPKSFVLHHSLLSESQYYFYRIRFDMSAQFIAFQIYMFGFCEQHRSWREMEWTEERPGEGEDLKMINDSR